MQTRQQLGTGEHAIKWGTSVITMAHFWESVGMRRSFAPHFRHLDDLFAPPNWSNLSFYPDLVGSHFELRAAHPCWFLPGVPSPGYTLENKYPSVHTWQLYVNPPPPPPGQKWPHFTRWCFQMRFREWKFYIFVKISMKFVPKGPIDNNSPALVQIMDWHRIGFWTTADLIHWRIYATLGGIT